MQLADEMGTVSVGLLVLGTQAISWYGWIDQLRLTHSRRTTEGLSFFDAECRVWGRLPWLAYALFLAPTDVVLLTANVAGIALGLLALLQFVAYAGTPRRIRPLRVLLAWTAVLATFALAGGAGTLPGTTERSFYALLLSAAPLLATVASLFLGSWSQFTENARRGSTEALSTTRYLLLLLTSALWFCYGSVQPAHADAAHGTVICAGAAAGLICYGAILLQIAALRIAPMRDAAWRRKIA